MREKQPRSSSLRKRKRAQMNHAFVNNRLFWCNATIEKLHTLVFFNKGKSFVMTTLTEQEPKMTRHYKRKNLPGDRADEILRWHEHKTTWQDAHPYPLHKSLNFWNKYSNLTNRSFCFIMCNDNNKPPPNYTCIIYYLIRSFILTSLRREVY